MPSRARPDPRSKSNPAADEADDAADDGFNDDAFDASLHDADDAPDASGSSDDTSPWDPEKPSKTRKKQESHDLQALGRELLALPTQRLAQIEMPERLRDALELMQRTRSHEGKRRQLQYIGKVMRLLDPEPLREAVAAYRVPGARETLALHQGEQWRDRLLKDDSALTEWLASHPGSDVQALRTLIRNARKEEQAHVALPHDGPTERKGRAYRELFQLVRQTLTAAAKAEREQQARQAEEDELDD
ncbi:MAG: ribosome biogenesis factor YjgA [Leptothrix sp. (in: b-proteobacteria)]